jgi:hypothetical protein
MDSLSTEQEVIIKKIRNHIQSLSPNNDQDVATLINQTHVISQQLNDLIHQLSLLNQQDYHRYQHTKKASINPFKKLSYKLKSKLLKSHLEPIVKQQTKYNALLTNIIGLMNQLNTHNLTILNQSLASKKAHGSTNEHSD